MLFKFFSLSEKLFLLVSKSLFERMEFLSPIFHRGYFLKRHAIINKVFLILKWLTYNIWRILMGTKR
jgi:hypothetical protein